MKKSIILKKELKQCELQKRFRSMSGMVKTPSSGHKLQSN